MPFLRKIQSTNRERAKLGLALVFLFALGFTLIILGNSLRGPDIPATCTIGPGQSHLDVTVASPHQSSIPSILLSTGGVLFGIGLSTLISVVFVPSQLDSIVRLLHDMNSVPWKSDDDHLKPFRRKFQGYLLSQNEDKTWVWRYREFDFGKLKPSGYLEAVVEYQNPNKEDARFRYFGFVLQSRLFLIGFNEISPREPVVLHVFPHCGHSGVHAGYAFLETLADTSLVTRTLLSHRPLEEGVSCPSFIEDKLDLNLNKQWRMTFKSKQIGLDIKAPGDNEVAPEVT